MYKRQDFIQVFTRGGTLRVNDQQGLFLGLHLTGGVHKLPVRKRSYNYMQG